MSYTKQTFTSGQILKASDLNTMSQGIVDKQDKLVSGTNIKTINGQSLLGSGNISVEAEIPDVSTTFNVIPKPVASTFYNGKKIACIGDSITQGVGASDDSKRYTAVGGGQCNIIATSTVNSSIKTSCFFTTTAQSEGGDEGEASNYVLGANVTYNTSSNTLTGSKASGAYASQGNTAIYKVPLKAGMEVEIIQTIPSDYKTYIGWGVDDTTEISELTYANAKYPTGMFCFYIDSGKDNIQALSYGSLTPRYELDVNGGKTSPRVSVIKRDASGNLSATFGGQAVTMPSHEGVTAANETENLYVWIGGIDKASTWKINYFGPLR